MQIEVACPCGRRFPLPAALAGRQVRCPSCDQFVEAPADAPLLAQVSMNRPPKVAPEAVQWTAPHSRPQSSATGVIVAVIAIGMLMMLGFIVLVGLMFVGFQQTGGATVVGRVPTAAAPLVGEDVAPPFSLEIVRPDKAADISPTRDVSVVQKEVLKLYQDGQYEEALPKQYWIVNHSNGGEYNMACLFALLGDSDAAFYWLQQSFIRDEGITVSKANSDTDLESLWSDDRWEEMNRYMVSATSCAPTNPQADFQTVVTSNQITASPPPAIFVALPGPGQLPSDFVSTEKCQAFADEHNVRVVAAQGPLETLQSGFHWSNSVEQNRLAIEQRVGRLGETVTPDRIYLVGFSQGASVAAELIAAYPDHFRGAVLISPTTVESAFDTSLKDVWRHYNVVVARHGNEHPEVLKASDELASGLTKAGAKVRRETLSDGPFHELPEDIWSRIGKWMIFLDETRDSEPAEPSGGKPGESADKAKSGNDFEAPPAP